jgi:probable rRNA maturation factor
MSSSIHFYYSGVSFPFKDRNKLKLFLSSLFKKEGKKLQSLNYVFCTDEELLKLNIQWLDHNTLTDIITFDLSETEKVTGEIYISIDRVRENARSFSRPFSEELHRVIFHGALHLCGYKDKTQAQQSEMRGKEEAYLNRYFE